MPKVVGYRRTEDNGALSPVRVGADMDTRAQAAVVQSAMPGTVGADVIKAGAGARLARGKRATELMKAGAEVRQTAGEQDVRMKMLSARSEALGLESAAQILTAAGVRFMKMQQDYDASEVMNATNEWHDYVNKYWNDPEGGVKATRQMGNSKGVYEDTGRYLSELTGRIYGGLRTQAQRQAFLRAISGSRMATEERASVFEAQEMDRFTKESTKATIQSAINSVVEDSSLTNFNSQFERARDALLYNMRAMDEATKQTAVDGLRSDFQSAITASLVDKDPLKAEAYFNQVQGEILPDVRSKLEAGIKKAALPVKAIGLYKQVGGDYEAGMAYIEQNVPDMDKKAFADAFQSYWSDQESVKNARYKKADEALTERYLDTGGLSGVDLQGMVDRGELRPQDALQWKKILQADRERAIAKAMARASVGRAEMSAGQLVMAQNIYNKAAALARMGCSPAEIAEECGDDLRAAFGSNNALKSVLKMTVPRAAGGASKKSLYSASDIVRGMAADAGVNNSPKAMLDFENEYQNMLAEWAKKKGGALDEYEMVEAGKQLLETKKLVRRTGWFDGIKDATLEVPAYQFKWLGIDPDTVRWDNKIKSWVAIKNGKPVKLDDADFTVLTPKSEKKKKYKE